MKIVILTGWYPNEVIVEDGLSVRNQAIALRSSGLDISVVSVSLMKDFFFKKPIKKFTKSLYKNLPQYSLAGFHPSRKTSFLFKDYNNLVLKTFNRYVKENGLPDIVHVHNYTVGLAALAIKRTYGIPFVLTEHSTSFMDGWVPESHRKFIDEIFEGAEYVYGVSSALARAMTPYSTKEVGVMPNFIDTRIFYPPDRYTPLTNGPKLLTVSTFSPRKQIDLLIKLIPQLKLLYPNIQFNLVGYGPEESRLEALISTLNVQENVKILGPASQEKVAQYMREHHLFITASHTETFGVVYVEALACGLPLVALDCGGVHDIIDHGTNGYIVEDIETMATFISQSIDNYMAFDKDKMVETCQNAFGIQTNVARHKQLYSDLIKT